MKEMGGRRPQGFGHQTDNEGGDVDHIRLSQLEMSTNMRLDDIKVLDVKITC